MSAERETPSATMGAVLAAIGYQGAPIEDACPCGGKMAGYRKHLKAGEEPCPESRADTNAWHRAYHRRKRQAVTG